MTTATETRELKDETFSRVAEVRGQEGSFYIVRRGPRNTRVLSIGSPQGSGVLVSTEDILNERDNSGEPPTPPPPQQKQKRRQRFVRK